MHRKHQTKHKKKPCKHVMVSKMEEPVADPLWADLCIQGGTAGDTTGEEEDEFSVLHGRWLQTQEEEQRLWEEGEHCVMHIHNHLLHTHGYSHGLVLHRAFPSSSFDCLKVCKLYMGSRIGQWEGLGMVL